MANTFSLDSASSYQGRYMYVSCSQQTDIATNTSTINWSLTVTGGTSNYYDTGATTLVINGVTVYSKERTYWNSYSFPAAKGTVSGSLKVAHNDSGNATINVSLSTAIYFIEIKTASSSWALDTIPRQANITAAPNFNDEENPTISYSNAAGNNVTTLQACIANETGGVVYVPYRDISKINKSYTFELTEAERNTLRAAASNSNTLAVRFYIKSIIGGITYYSYSASKTLTIINAAPKLVPNAYDTNTATIALTGDNKVLVRYMSNVYASTGAEAVKGASITYQNIINGNKTVEAATATFNAVESGSFAFNVTDSRGNSTPSFIARKLINYVKLTCNIGNSKPDANGNLNFTVSGNYFGGSFGATTNSLTVQYRYKASGGSYSSWYSMSANVSGTTYNASVNITGLDYRTNYIFQARAFDKLAVVDSEEKPIKTTPVFDWGENDFNFNVPVSIEGSPLQDYIIEQGTAAMGSNGTWYWSKWKSGKAECYGCRNYGNMGITGAFGSCFISTYFSQELPSGLFSKAPDVIAINVRNAANMGTWIIDNGTDIQPTATSTTYFRVASATSGTASQVYISFNIIGRWK
jgi:hypothetical protein